MKVLLAAGGTGGHIFPALAVADALKKRGVEVIFAGAGKELEQKLIPPAGFSLFTVPFSPVTGKGFSGALKTLCMFPRAFAIGRSLLSEQKVDAVLSFGGYPSFIPLFCAWTKQIPRALHEQNVQVGLANKISALISKRIFAVPRAHGFVGGRESRVETVPNPVRASFYNIPEWQAPRPGEPFRILVIGGSQGAVSLNNAVLSCAAELSGLGVQLVHQTGEADLVRVEKFYTENRYQWASARAFIADIAAEYDRAHLIISRAGAMSAAEIAASGRPAIFVPLAIAQAHQQENIRSLLDAGGALKVDQNDKTGEELQKLLPTLIPDHSRLRAIAQGARSLSRVGTQTSAEFLAEQIISLAGTKAAELP